MTLDEIVEKLMADPRNASFTGRGIGPIFQIHPVSKLLIIGQAPGRKVEESRIPFHDKSGEQLIRWLGIDEKTFYGEDISIMPMDFYYPGKGKTGDLPPRPFIAKEYHEELLRLMPDVQLTVLLGRYAVDFYLNDSAFPSLAGTVSHYALYLPRYFPLIHPSPLNRRWIKQRPWFEEEVIPALKENVRNVLSS